MGCLALTIITIFAFKFHWLLGTAIIVLILSLQK